MKEKNIYDNTAILVCADHGPEIGKFTTPHDMIFMLKPFYENNTELTIDDSKVQSIDIPPTLLKIISGVDADFKEFEGYPSFDVPKNRVRKVYRPCHIEDRPDPDPIFAKSYPGINGFNEYNFIDVDSFRASTDSKLFVQQIPLTPLKQRAN